MRVTPAISALDLQKRQFPDLSLPPGLSPADQVEIRGCRQIPFRQLFRVEGQPGFRSERSLRLFVVGLLGWDSAGHAVLAERSALARAAPAFFCVDGAGLDLLLAAAKHGDGVIKDERLAAAAVMMRNNEGFDTTCHNTLIDHGYLGLWRGEHICVDPCLIDGWAGLDPYAEHRRRLASFDIEPE